MSGGPPDGRRSDAAGCAQGFRDRPGAAEDLGGAMSSGERNDEPAGPAIDPLGRVAVRLLRGVVLRDRDPGLWETLIRLRARTGDYMAVLGLELVVDEGEGYAYLHSRSDAGDGSRAVPRLIPRRPLSFNVSLLLALLRRRLVQQDATGGETRLVMSRAEIAELVRVFLPENSNEARLMERLDANLNRIVELGFLRHMKAQDGARGREFEVQRFLKAFVDAQWLTEFDSRLAAYRSELERTSP